jgi:hypothetical protein
LIKAAVGSYVGGIWTPQNPAGGGTPTTNFSIISGKYASGPFSISDGTPDTSPPGDVTPVISTSLTDFTLDFTSYNEALQGDVVKYRVYVSKSSFSSVSGRQLLNDSTVPAVTTSGNHASFSPDIGGSGLFYFEIPPGVEFPLLISGLSPNIQYYFAMTAVDLAGNESTPQVVSGELVVGAVSGHVTNGTSGLPNIR